jgi:cell division protease FtsH
MIKKLRFKAHGVPTRMIFDLARFDRMTRPIQDDFSCRKNAEKKTAADAVKLRAKQVKPDARASIIAATFDAATSAAVRARLKSRKSGLAVIVLVPTPHRVKPVASYFEMTFGEHWSMTVRDGSNRSQHQATVGSDDVATSLSDGGCVVGIAADRKILPQTLTIVADLTIRLKAPRGDVVADAIRRFTGRRQMGRIEDNVVMGLDITDLIAAFRKGCSAKSIVTRLKAASIALKGGGAEPEHLPLLETAVEYGRARTWGLNLTRDIAEYRAGRLLWSAIDRGVVLHSEPGTGKSLYSRILAQACGLPLLVSSVADWFLCGQGYLNDVIRAERAVFAQAAALAPCIVFLDEIDAIPNRATLSERNRDYWTPLINDILSNLDNAVAETRRGVIVIGATNNVHALDAALTRPGRLERTIEIERPDLAGTLNILKHHVAGALPDTDLKEIAGMIEGSTGAEIMQIVRDARRIARHSGRPLSVEDLRMAVVPPEDINPDALWRICVHEAAHAVVALAVPYGTLKRCVVGSKAGAAGRTVVEPNSDDLMTLKRLLDHAVVILSGRVAELVILGAASVASGGDDTSDIALVTRMIAVLHASAGLGETLVYLASHEDALMAVRHDRALRSRVERDLRKVEARTVKIVRRHRRAIVAVAEALAVKRHLSGDAVRDIFEASSPRG